MAAVLVLVGSACQGSGGHVAQASSSGHRLDYVVTGRSVEATAGTGARNVQEASDFLGSVGLRVNGRGRGAAVDALPPRTTESEILAGLVMLDFPAASPAAAPTSEPLSTIQLVLHEAERSPAARLCRMLVIAEVPAAPERCRVEARLDPRDGWPILARITRMRASAYSGAEAERSVTFVRATTRP
ncbi:MAG TPA: hypothetical protein VF552_03015 [Allosphingosinicella sp.]